MIREATSFLLSSQNADGGWGSEPGRPSSTEATALSLLALPGHAGPSGRALEWLRSRQRTDGSWPATDQVPEGSWMTGVAVLALAHLTAERGRAVRGAEWLLGVEGSRMPLFRRLLVRVFTPGTNALDDSLLGWPWVEGATGWVEPTAHALLALRALRADLPAGAVEERTRDGERMLLDRTCPRGGWNYGNSRVLGTDLHPYPDTTALALLALRERAEHPRVRGSLDALDGILGESRSGLSLALSALCLQAYGRDDSALRARLAESYRETGFLGQTRPAALALLVLTGGVRFFQPPDHA